jgi:hypothetical protein
LGVQFEHTAAIARMVIWMSLLYIIFDCNIVIFGLLLLFSFNVLSDL